MTDTLLEVTGIGIPPYAARGLNQTLEPIEQAKVLRRTVNGELKDISAPQFQKYKSTITCTDQQVPAIDGIWPGEPVVINCVQQLSFPVGGVSQRAAVPGSSHDENGFTFYRPVLTMIVTNFSVNTDEFGANIGWTLELEEI